MGEGELIVREQRTVAFYEDEIVAVRDEGGTVWLPVRHVCDLLGVDRTAQIRRIQRDVVMSRHLDTLPVTLPDGRRYEMDCLPLKYVRAWLFGINASRVKEEIRDKLVRYQEEVIEIIDRAFSRDLPAEGLDDAVIRAMRDNALQQAQLWEMMLAEKRRLRLTEELVQEHDDQLLAHEKRLWQHDLTLGEALSELARLREQQGAIAARFSDVARLLPTPTDTIGPAQKAALKALVDDLVAAAEAKGVRLGQGRNNYPAVWGAFKQRFDLARYDELTLAHYDDALAWLKGWLDRVRDEGS